MGVLELDATMNHLDELFDGYAEHLSVHELTEILGVARTTVYKWLHEGAIPGYRVGGSWLVLRDEVKESMLAGRNLPTLPADPTSATGE